MINNDDEVSDSQRAYLLDNAVRQYPVPFYNHNPNATLDGRTTSASAESLNSNNEEARYVHPLAAIESVMKNLKNWHDENQGKAHSGSASNLPPAIKTLTTTLKSGITGTSNGNVTIANQNHNVTNGGVRCASLARA